MTSAYVKWLFVVIFGDMEVIHTKVDRNNINREICELQESNIKNLKTYMMQR